MPLAVRRIFGIQSEIVIGSFCGEFQKTEIQKPIHVMIMFDDKTFTSIQYELKVKTW